jgi:hypothetical protein
MDAGSHTPESLSTIAAALEAIANRLTRTAAAMKEKEIASLEVKNLSGLKAGMSSLRSFGMAAEEAFEEWIFDQNVFKDGTSSAGEAAKPRSEGPAKKHKKPPEPKPETEAD